jgi:hypothetical protein
MMLLITPLKDREFNPLMLKIIFEVQNTEQALAHAAGNFGIFGGFMVQGNSLVQRVYDDPAILAFAKMAVNFLAKFIAQAPIQVIA